MLTIYTAQYRYSGKNRLDITVKGKDPVGSWFAPTWEMVMKTKKGLMSKDEYTRKYYSLMRERYREHPDIFNDLLKRDEAVFVCFEKPEEGFCHRYILANIFTKMGATYKGELNTDGSFRGKVDLEAFEEPV
jgi:hypothetical protein